MGMPINLQRPPPNDLSDSIGDATFESQDPDSNSPANPTVLSGVKSFGKEAADATMKRKAGGREDRNILGALQGARPGLRNETCLETLEEEEEGSKLIQGIDIQRHHWGWCHLV